MEYNLLVRNNPTGANLTQGSSQWLASRIMPGKGTSTDISLICIPDFNVTDGAAMRTCANGDVKIAALLGINPSNNTIVNYESNASSIVWRGCWVSGNSPLIGRGHATLGLICPFNTFNVGYRYSKRNWRPNRVSYPNVI